MMSIMPQMLIFPKPRVPREIACQIRSYQRMQWPGVFGGGKVWPITPASAGNSTFVMMDDEVLLSHLEVNHRPIDLGGQSLRVYGLSSVFTYPAHRGQGFSGQLVHAATQFIKTSDADLAMLFCGPKPITLYQRCGWEIITPPAVTFGDPPKRYDDTVMALFISALGQQMRPTLASNPLHLPQGTW